jgi:hypothetical protein
MARPESTSPYARGKSLPAPPHMLMQDDNSLDIADILLDWIGKHVTTAVQ